MKASQRVGIQRWARPGLFELDTKLINTIEPARNGIFIEFGANDGLQQSNSYALEVEFGWSGVLIEPIPSLAAECLRNRPGCSVIVAVISAPEVAGQPIPLVDADLLTHVGSSNMYTTATTLSAVIDRTLGATVPDLLSIDVEGHELEALRGLDRSRHLPTWILVETETPQPVKELLSPEYKMHAQLSFHDYLFRSEVRHENRD